MKLREYLKIHYPKTRSNIKNFFKTYIIPSILYSIGVLIIGYSFKTISIFGGILILFISFVFLVCWKFLYEQKRIYEEQQDIINSKEKAIESLKEQLKPKLRIDLEENSPDYYYESEWFELLSLSFGRKKVFDGYDKNLTYLRLCRISIYNSSPVKAIENVEVKLMQIDKLPDKLKGVLSIHLELKDDRKGRKAFILNPKASQLIDVVKWKLTPEKATPEYVFCNVLKDVDTSVPIYNSKIEYKITIQVTGKDTPCETRDFKVGMVNKKNTFEKMWIWPV